MTTNKELLDSETILRIAHLEYELQETEKELAIWVRMKRAFLLLKLDDGLTHLDDEAVTYISTHIDVCQIYKNNLLVSIKRLGGK